MICAGSLQWRCATRSWQFDHCGSFHSSGELICSFFLEAVGFRSQSCADPFQINNNYLVAMIILTVMLMVITPEGYFRNFWVGMCR